MWLQIQDLIRLQHYQPWSNSFLNCIAINAGSLKSLHSVNGKQTSNLTRFQELVYIEHADLAFVTETWLNKDITNAEILTNDYEIYRQVEEAVLVAC